MLRLPLVSRSFSSRKRLPFSIRSSSKTNFCSNLKIFNSKMSSTNSSVRSDFNRLKSILEEVSSLQSISALLEWDQLVMMPEKSGGSRGKQMEVLVGVIHDKSTGKEIEELLNKLKGESIEKELTDWEKAHLRDARRDFERTNKLPKELQMKRATLSVEGHEVWANARKEKNFAKFAPILKQWVDIVREEAKLLDPTKDAYDVLLDTYERGVSSSTIDTVFNQLKEKIPPLIAKIAAKPSPDRQFMQGKKFDVEAQAKFNFQLAKELGFDTDGGRLDVSVHPFSTSFHPSDVRMTTRYKDDELIEGLTGTIHETGHSLYEQGRPESEAYLPASRAVGMGVHESQSLLWERMVGLSLPFWSHYWPKLQSAFPQLDSSVTFEQFYRLINESKPGFIRVEADEVTYPMHIILRYEIEKDLISGKIQVDQLPQIWNEKMKQYLGIVPKDDSEGVLQDVHWSSGSFGYFPTYTLGAIYACQYFQQAEKEIPDLNEKMAAGDFKALRAWLKEKIHQKGSFTPSGDELVKQITGSGLNATQFIEYLTKKYTKLYNL
eukprot:TRINITY_DN8469_c0_g1_i2.p1 TRINITY_DN8469_c0_g1~~TRINITY_DN8469_c0_g1_i2.p1  ORF type:complete len:549 (+),score=205.68 TRINITY_DN8469_c0_g1_i2:30-1676(+)